MRIKSTDLKKKSFVLVFFKSALLILTVSTNTFQSTTLFCCFSRYQAPTNSVAPSFCMSTTHNPQFLDSFRRRANAWNVSFRISLRWPIHIINPVDKTSSHKIVLGSHTGTPSIQVPFSINVINVISEFKGSRPCTQAWALCPWKEGFGLHKCPTGIALERCALASIVNIA